MLVSWHKIGRIVLVVAVVLFFAASAMSAERTPGKHHQGSALVTMIKVPVKMFTRVAIRQAKLERDVSNKILHAGVDLFTKSIRWLSKREAPKQQSAPDWDIRNW